LRWALTLPPLLRFAAVPRAARMAYMAGGALIATARAVPPACARPAPGPRRRASAARISASAAQPADPGPASSPPAFSLPPVSASIAVGASNAALLDALAAPPLTTATTTTSALSFDWAAHWYPIAALDSLDPTVPFPLTILGERIVVWRDGEGAWKALRDACPHRLAPLSEGRIAEDGTLQVRRGGTSSAALRRCALRCSPACRA
jgi:hypothetical protein